MRHAASALLKRNASGIPKGQVPLAGVWGRRPHFLKALADYVDFDGELKLGPGAVSGQNRAAPDERQRQAGPVPQ